MTHQFQISGADGLQAEATPKLLRQYLGVREGNRLKATFAAISMVALSSCSSTPTGGQQQAACVEKDTIAQSTACFAASVIRQGDQFPNPVGAGSTQHIQFKIGAVNAQFSPINPTISTRVFSAVTGQLVDQQNLGSVPGSANFQAVPVWTPSNNIASGTYTLEVTIDVGACGVKTMCIDNRTVVVK